jgi:hypothetical protein
VRGRDYILARIAIAKECLTSLVISRQWARLFSKNEVQNLHRRVLGKGTGLAFGSNDSGRDNGECSPKSRE